MQFRFEVSLANNGLAIIEGSSIKYWKNEGLPTYEGGFDGFNIEFPAVMQEMVDRGIFKED